MSRRKFIKQSFLATGGLLLHAEMLKAFSGTELEGKINIGVIGCGDRGKGLMEIMKQLPGQFNIIAVCDVLDFRLTEAQKIESSPQLKLYKEYKQLLDNKSIQAVAIAVPLNMHYEIAAASLQAGKHVYLEKTMTYNIPQAENLVSLVKKYPSQTFQVGHQYRYTPLYFKVKEMIEKGYLGKVTQIDCRWDRNWNWKRPIPDPSLERKINWRMYREYSGGLPAELLSHQIDFINWAFATHPDEIFGTGGIDFYKDGRETYDNVQVMLRYKKEGMIGNFGATCGNARDGYLFKLKGTKGTISLLVNEGIYYPEAQQKKELQTVDGVTGATKITWNKDGGIPILTEPAKDGTWYALNDFYRSVFSMEQPTANVITGATTAVCVHLANHAIYNHTIENWNPAYNFS
ncbi:MAG: gfo/Idh/MocA family oxidoreductase [Chitinophagaceae bacterium]|nr:gfo/Idh/MocA family oxidoreductase [Chitinophagaceae bacterium]